MEQATERPPRLTYSFGPFHLDPAERRLIRNGCDLRLSPKVFETLVLLVQRHGLLVSKDDLMSTLWPGTFVEEVTLAGNISSLRKALSDESGQDQSQYIDTVSKRGYRFVAPVIEVAPASQTAKPQEAESLAATTASVKRWRSRWAWFAHFGLVLLVAGAATLWWFKAFRSSAVRIHSLAVLPLENLSNDSEQEYFADGMTDELITDLAQIHSLRVISRTSVMQFKHTKKTLPEIAQELNVDAIVEGSVSRQGNDVHINAQLLNASQDRHLWAASYQRQITDVLGLQSQIARAIAEQVQAQLTPEEHVRLTTRPSLNPEAYDALLKGRFLMTRKMSNVPQALPYFQKAVAIDPNNAEAWAAMADSYAHMGADLGNGDPATMRAQATAALTKALDLNPNLAEAHATAGWVKLWYDWDWIGAEQEFRRAIDLSPNSSVAHRYYSHFLNVRGRFDEAIAENLRAIDLGPLDIFAHAHLAWIYCDARLADKAIEQSKHLLEVDPSFNGAYQYLGRGYALKGQWPEAIAAYEHLKQGYWGAYQHGMMHAWAVAGNRQQLRSVLAEITAVTKARSIDIPPIIFAEGYAALGDHDKALEWLEKAYSKRSPQLINLKVDYYFDDLRSDPRFQDLERRVGF